MAHRLHMLLQPPQKSIKYGASAPASGGNSVPGATWFLKPASVLLNSPLAASSTAVRALTDILRAEHNRF